MPRIHTPLARRLVPALCALALGACAGAVGGSIVDVALNVARKTFLGVATENYGEQYSSDFDKLLTTLAKPVGDVSKNALGAEGSNPYPQTSADGSAPGYGSTDGSGTMGSSGTGGTGGTGGTTMGSAPADPNATATSWSPPPPAAPLELEVAILKEEIVGGRSIAVPVQDGEVVYDRFGGNGRGDNLKLTFRANQSCWVYVIGVDGTAWASTIFPSSFSAELNPVQAGKLYEIPEGRAWLTLDSYRGVENVYFVACRYARPDLEDALRQIAANVRDVDTTRAEEGQLAMVESAAPIARGFDSVRLSEVEGIETSDGVAHNVAAETFLAAQGVDQVVVPRWFRHQ